MVEPVGYKKKGVCHKHWNKLGAAPRKLYWILYGKQPFDKDTEHKQPTKEETDEA